MRIHVVYDTSETFLNLENVFFFLPFLCHYTLRMYFSVKYV